MALVINPAAPEHLPRFISAPGETDTSMVVMAVILVVAVLAIGLLFLRIHTLPERIAHRGSKLQFEIVAVLGLLALFTGYHVFWVIGLLLALIDLPDFGGALSRMAGALERIGSIPADKRANDAPDDPSAIDDPPEGTQLPLPIPAEKAATGPQS